MMRRLVERHRGILPLDTVESIWRVIIATFTYVQAPFSVHADLSAGEAAMRDAARFHFGFTVPFVTHMGAARRGRGDRGVARRSRAGAGDAAPPAPGGRRSKATVRRRSSRGCRSWSAPIIRPACRCLRSRGRNPDALVTDVETWSVRVAGWGPAVSRALDPSAEVIAVPDRAFDGAALLVSVPKGEIDALDLRHGQGRRLGALQGPRRQPRDPLYRHRRRPVAPAAEPGAGALMPPLSGGKDARAP